MSLLSRSAGHPLVHRRMLFSLCAVHPMVDITLAVTTHPWCRDNRCLIRSYGHIHFLQRHWRCFAKILQNGELPVCQIAQPDNETTLWKRLESMHCCSRRLL